tara:strand:+ start:3323 stop:3991 length:669 start_codon:yes stop_codon:yes gene_type:complete
MNFKIICIILFFILGFLFYSTNLKTQKEGFSISKDCPNLLVKKGEKIHLIYKNKAKIPGVNPMIFDNLEEYVEFLEWQRSKNIKCPVLYFEETYDAQNNRTFRMLPDPVDKKAGLPTTQKKQIPLQPLYDANHDDAPYNRNSFAGFDPQDQYVGAFTPLDRNFNFSGEKSVNAMDTNWGGVMYTRNIVDSTNKKSKKSQDIQKEIQSRYGKAINEPVVRALK